MIYPFGSCEHKPADMELEYGQIWMCWGCQQELKEQENVK